MHDYQTILADAQRLEKSAGEPRHTAKQYEDAMCDLAEHVAREGESVGSALSRLHADRDVRLASLAKAAHAAEMSERRAVVQRAGAEPAENQISLDPASFSRDRMPTGSLAGSGGRAGDPV